MPPHLDATPRWGRLFGYLGLALAATSVAGGAARLLGGVAGRVEHNFAERSGVKTHYVSLGQGPLVVLIHGVPEFWYSWRQQLGPLAEAGFRVVAVDQRGFNRSDSPVKRAAYATLEVVEDVAAVVRQEGYTAAHIVGHDSGALVAWLFATLHPDMTDKLAVLSVPHPNAFAEELATNPAQHDASAYARRMQQDDTRPAFRVGPIGVLRDPLGWPLYLAADARTDHRAISAFYQLNYPRPPYPVDETLPKVKAPTLVVHGRSDRFLLASGHDRNRQWTETEPQTVMLDAGHFVHQEKPEAVNRAFIRWFSKTL